MYNRFVGSKLTRNVLNGKKVMQCYDVRKYECIKAT